MITLPDVTVSVCRTTPFVNDKMLKIGKEVVHIGPCADVDEVSVDVNTVYTEYYRLTDTDPIGLVFAEMCYIAGLHPYPVIYRSDLFYRNLKQLLKDRPDRFVWCICSEASLVLLGNKHFDTTVRWAVDTYDAPLWYMYTADGGLVQTELVSEVLHFFDLDILL